MSLSADQERFAQLVARSTGLSVATVRTWVLSESAPEDPDGNPLNLMQWDGAGRRSVRRFASPDDAAAATVQLLRDPRYAPVLASAGQGPRAELQAIALSPWEENQYRGAGARVGALLEGAYARLYGPGSPGGGDAQTVALEFGGVAPFLPGPLGPLLIPLIPGVDKAGGKVLDALNPLDDEWFAKGFLHVALTALAVLLIVIGLNRSLGGVPAQLALGAVRRPAPDPIPF